MNNQRLEFSTHAGKAVTHVLRCPQRATLPRISPKVASGNLCVCLCVCYTVTFLNLQSERSLSVCVWLWKWKKKKMNPHSLFASAAINIGLALVTLTLFSIFKKQPSFAPIYYARRLSNGQQIHFHDQTFSFRCFLPSVSWIPRAFRVTEDEILDSSGLDALVIIRLFKFGSVFICFWICLLFYELSFT